MTAVTIDLGGGEILELPNGGFDLPKSGFGVDRYGLQWPAHEAGRTHQPVLRRSVPEAEAERFWWPERAWNLRRDILRAAERLMLRTFSARPRGSRRGALTLCEYDILRCLTDFWDVKSGKLDPSYSQIAEKTGHSRATISKALDVLEGLGLLERLRRFKTVTENDKVVEVRQTNNAYRLTLPPRLRKLLGLRGSAPIPCDQHTRNLTAFLENSKAIAAETGKPNVGSALYDMGLRVSRGRVP